MHPHEIANDPLRARQDSSTCPPLMSRELGWDLANQPRDPVIRGLVKQSRCLFEITVCKYAMGAGAWPPGGPHLLRAGASSQKSRRNWPSNPPKRYLAHRPGKLLADIDRWWCEPESARDILKQSAPVF